MQRPAKRYRHEEKLEAMDYSNGKYNMRSIPRRMHYHTAEFLDYLNSVEMSLLFELDDEAEAG